MPKSELFGQWQQGKISPVYSEKQSAGSVYFVSSTAPVGVNAAGYGDSPERPFANIAYALIEAAADTDTANDLIVVMPRHAETFVVPAALEFTKAGVTVLGVGNGASIPTITFGGADPTADININAANITLKHLSFVNTQDALAAPIDVNAADCTIEDCKFNDDGADNTLVWIALDANADRCLIKDCVNEGTDTAGNTSWISAGACDRLRVIGCYSHGDFAAGNIDITAAATDFQISNCWLENPNAVDVNVEGTAAMTGWIDNCMCQVPTDAQVTWINTPGNAYVFRNFGCNQPGETGKLVVAAGTSV